MSGRTRSVAPRLLSAFFAVTLLLLALPMASVRAADQADYSATQVEDWLVDQIETTTVEVTTTPTVTLNAANKRLLVDDLTFEAWGTTVGLDELMLTFTGTDTDPDTSVALTATLSVLGRTPRFKCNLVIESTGGDGLLRVASISDVEIAEHTFSLSTEDLDAIAEKLNSVIDASGVSIESPGTELLSINIVDDAGTPKVELTWTEDDITMHLASSIQQAASDAADTLADKANSYFREVTPRWNVAVGIADGTLQVDCEFPFCDMTMGLRDCSIEFDTLDASVTDATLYIGATQEATFSVGAEIDVTHGIPSITMTELTVDEVQHPGMADCVADNEAALMDAIDQAVDNVVDDTGLTTGIDTAVRIYVTEGDMLRLEGPGLVEGDTTMDGRTNIVDAMFIAQYTVGLREFTPDQMKAGDTTDDGRTNIVDAMHVAQYTVDPTTAGHVLFKLLWQSPEDDDMIDPLTVP